MSGTAGAWVLSVFLLANQHTPSVVHRHGYNTQAQCEQAKREIWSKYGGTSIEVRGTHYNVRGQRYYMNRISCEPRGQEPPYSLFGAIDGPSGVMVPWRRPLGCAPDDIVPQSCMRNRP